MPSCENDQDISQNHPTFLSLPTSSPILQSHHVNEFYFYFQMQNRTAHIELGGKPLSPTKYLQKPYPPQQAPTLVSSHKITNKLSPSKYKVYTTRTSRQPSNLTSENSFIQLRDLDTSQGNYTPVKAHSPLRDTSNLTICSPRQLVRVNYVANSPTCSRTSSIHARQLVASPGKMMGVEGQPRDEVLERRLRVLQGRIGELHREKHEMAGKLNEENRKAYHENTALKMRINELLKKMEKSQTLTVAVDSKAEAEAQALRADVAKLEKMVEKLTEQSGSLIKQCQQLKEQLQQSKQASQQLQTQNQSLSKALKQKQVEYGSLHCEYLQLSEQKLQLLSQKQHYEQQFQQIQASLAEASQGNTLIIEEYQSKLEQYRVAYDRNQEVIEQLSQQVQLAYSQQHQQPQSTEMYPPEEDAIIVNAESQGQLAQQCKDLQSNFLTALEQRDHQLQLLEEKNQELTVQLQRKEQDVEELNGLVEAQAGRLEKVADALERYTAKMQEMEGRYEQLRQRHELQVQKGKGAPLVVQKCKKCEELTKTIFRLNSHLNKRT